MLDAIGAGIAPRVGDRDWKDVWLDSKEYSEMRAEIDRIKSECVAKPLSENDKPASCKPLIYLRVYPQPNDIA